MDHNDIRHKLSEYIDGAVAPGEKAAIEQHLKTCGECADALRELRKTIEHIHAVGEVESPAWMTQQIMAKVRKEAEEKKGLWHWQRVFAPFLMKFPVQAVAVLFLSVTAFYLYTTMHPAEKHAEAPMERFAKQEAHNGLRDAHKQKAPEITGRREKKIAQGSDYKALDMKYEYEKPAPPVPQEQPAASAPAPAKREAKMYARAKADLEKRSASLRAEAVAPSMMAEQAAPAAGATQLPIAKEAASPETHRAKDALSVDKDAEARLAVTEHFVNFDLPAKKKVKGLSFAIRTFETDDTHLQWMQKTTTYKSRPCTSKYVVDVELPGSLSKYLYCYDHSKVKLLSVFEFKNGNWSEIK